MFILAIYILSLYVHVYIQLVPRKIADFFYVSYATSSSTRCAPYTRCVPYNLVTNGSGLCSELMGSVTIRENKMDGVSNKSSEGQIKNQIKVGSAFDQIKVG